MIRSRVAPESVRGSERPSRIPGEYKKISFTDGSPLIVFFTCKMLRSTMLSSRKVIETYLIHMQAETSLSPTFASFRREFKVYLDNADVVDLRAYRVHPIRGWCDKDTLASWCAADAHE